MTETRRTGGTKPSERAAEHTPNLTLLDDMGGLSGLVYTGLPIVTFVVANTIAGPHVAIAISAGAGITLLRLLRKEPIQPAISGLFALPSPRSSRTRRGPGALAAGRGYLEPAQRERQRVAHGQALSARF